MKSSAAGVHVRYESRQHYVMVQLIRLGLQHLAVGSCVKPGLLQLHQSMWHVQGMTAHHEVIAIPASAQKTITLKSLRYKVASNPLDPPVSMLMGDVCDLAIMIVFFTWANHSVNKQHPTTLILGGQGGYSSLSYRWLFFAQTPVLQWCLVSLCCDPFALKRVRNMRAKMKQTGDLGCLLQPN